MIAPLRGSAPLPCASDWYVAAIERLVSVVQQLSDAHDLEAIGAIVRDAARSLTGADGATFVLRDGDQCFYAEENAISPLWKGRRFPMSMCISGWVMMHAESVIIEDIYADPRIPVDAYRPTFVKSMVMVPVRRQSPIAAIGNYWATQRMPTQEEVSILQALADTTSVAIQNAHLYAQLQHQLRALQESNYELARFAWVASHDLQEPLRTITTQVELLERHLQASQLDEKSLRFMHMAAGGARQLQELIEALLVHAQVEKVEDFKPVELSDVLARVQRDMKNALDTAYASIKADALPRVQGNEVLLGRVWHNLISNALKFQEPGNDPDIRIGCARSGGEWVFSVQDNGIGIEPEYIQRIFGLFQRLHSKERYPGPGVGLATSKKIIEMHGGHMWAESMPGTGSTFFFTLPAGDAA